MRGRDRLKKRKIWTLPFLTPFMVLSSCHMKILSFHGTRGVSLRTQADFNEVRGSLAPCSGSHLIRKQLQSTYLKGNVWPTGILSSIQPRSRRQWGIFGTVGW
jgi:hypothetical protein